MMRQTFGKAKDAYLRSSIGTRIEIPASRERHEERGAVLPLREMAETKQQMRRGGVLKVNMSEGKRLQVTDGHRVILSVERMGLRIGARADARAGGNADV